MDLRTHYPYSLLRRGIVNSYPSLQKNMRCDVAVIGAGITGAVTAWHLQKAGIGAALFDRRHAGMGSTAASTGLLQYEIDVPLHALVKKVGYADATRSYLLCRQSIFDIKDICKELKTKTTFHLRNSFQYASSQKDVAALATEYSLRKELGLAVDWMEEEDIVTRFGFSKPAGLYSRDGAEIDPYNFTHALINDFSQGGGPVFDHTDIISIRHHKRRVELITASGNKITARKMVIACGYESQKYLPKKVEKFLSTYAIIGEPSPEKKWHKNCLIWETATPYLYIRTMDNRILIGGMDDEFTDARKRTQALPVKARALEKSFQKLFPAIPFTKDFQWAGTFATTKDGLPYIGAIARHPDTYFALGFGGNGITFSVIAAQLIRDILTGKKNKDLPLFSFQR